MRNLSPLAISILSNPQGLEPIMVLGIVWTSGIEYFYADTELPEAPGIILTMGNIENVTKFDGVGSSSNISIVLDDSANLIKPFFDIIDIHKVPAKIYQLFKGIPFSDKFLIFQGEIVSPIVWKEGDRSFSFDVVSTIQDNEVGFTPEEGLFTNLPYFGIGKPWPLVFGTATNVPGLTYQPTPNASIAQPVGNFYFQAGNEGSQDFYNAGRDLLDAIQQNAYAKFWLENAELSGLAGDDTTSDGSNLESAKYQIAFQQKLQAANAKILAGNNAILRASNQYLTQQNKYTGAPTATVTQQGIPGTTSYGYWTVSVDSNGNHSPVLFAGSTTTGSANLGNVEDSADNPGGVADANVITISCDAIGVVQIFLLRTVYPGGIPVNVAPHGQGPWLVGGGIMSPDSQDLVIVDSAATPGGYNVPTGGDTTLLYNRVHSLMEGSLVLNAEYFEPNVWLDCLVGNREMLVMFTNINLNTGDAIAYFQDLEQPIFNLVPYMNGTILSVIEAAKGGSAIDSGNPLYSLNPNIPFQIDFSFEPFSTYVEPAINDPIFLGASAIPQYTIPIVNQQLSALILNGGTSITLYGNGKQPTLATIDWIVDSNPSIVDGVFAYRNLNNVKTLYQVPASYYQVVYVTYGSITATVIRMNNPLSSYSGQDWEDQIYATVTSGATPVSNTVYQIIWIIDTYTTKTWDQDSFALAASYCAMYPSNFYIADKKNVIQMLDEMSYQARCSVWLDNDVFKIKFLPAVDTVVDILTENDVLLQSMEVSCDDTSKLITKYVAKWRNSYEESKGDNLVVVRNNYIKYGVVEQQYDFYIYNLQEMVAISASFWMFRKSNTFKLMKIKCPLTKLALETFDTIYLNFSHPYVANDPTNTLGPYGTLAVVQGCTYDPSTQTANLDLWLPILFGDMFQYPGAWPYDLPENFIIPPQYDVISSHSQVHQIPVNVLGTLPVVVNQIPHAVIDVSGTIAADTRAALANGQPAAPVVNGQQLYFGGTGTTDLGVVKPSGVDYTGPTPVPSPLSTIPVISVNATPVPVTTPIDAVALGTTTTKGDSDTMNRSLQYLIQRVADGVSGGAGGGGGTPGIVADYVGFFVDGDGNTSDTAQIYNVNIYKKGFNGVATLIQAIQMQIDDTDTIPAGTAVEIVSVVNAVGTVEYYMQVPVWIDTTTPSS
jgi:hypothetical protein